MDVDCCNTCHGLGYIVTCCDDVCANSDHCIHGNGEETCPDCGGDGEEHPHEDEEV
jgi:hypothetical protein